jgi:iron complex transport system permease protein
VLLLLTVLAFGAGLFIGSFPTDFSTLRGALFAYNPDDPAHFSIVNLRLPRVLLAFLVGGALSFSGYLIQAMVNNPLADPYILGTAAGASLGANVAFFGWLPTAALGLYLPPLFAFAGALCVTLVVVALAYKRGYIVPTQLLLGGVAVSSLITATNSLLAFLSDTEGKLKTIVFWILGSFERAQWSDVPLVGVALVLANGLFLFLYKQLALLLLGESRAYHLGLNVSRLRWVVLVTASLITGVAVATSGAIGFVGLMMPHLIRGLQGAAGRWNILLCTWAGGVFIIDCDLLTRLVYPPAGLPIGILTSFIGVPFFLYLLIKKDYRFE